MKEKGKGELELVERSGQFRKGKFQEISWKMTLVGLHKEVYE